MRNWRDEHYRTLKEVSHEANSHLPWAEFGMYCDLQERGLRRQAFHALDAFIAKIEKAPFDARRDFVSWLLHRADDRDGLSALVPHPLRTKVVAPTLEEWITVSPDSAEPFRWLGTLHDLRRAMALDPFDEIASRRFIKYALAHVGYSVHELPAGYLGDPIEDLGILAEAELAANALSNVTQKTRARMWISDLRVAVETYVATRVS